MGVMKEYAMSLRDRAHAAPALTIADGRSLMWEDIELVTEGMLGTFALPCPYCAPEKKSSTRFRVERESISRARWHCFYCGEHGSVSNGELVDEGREAAARDLAARRQAERKEANTAKALAFWNDAVPVTGTPVIDYLARRAIHDLPPQVDSVLRFHPACPFGREGRRPCLLALMRDVRTDEPKAVHRTWIGMAAKPLGRMALGPIARAAVKLWPASTGQLVVGEGIETTLAAAFYIHRDNGDACRPAWALTVANNLRGLPALQAFERLVILVDNDVKGDGQRAARVCSARWRGAGKETVTLTPNTLGADFNDIVLERAK
jgi:hypothetical protein